MFPYETTFSFYESGLNPHSITCGFYQIHYFSNIDIVSKSKLFVNINGNYHKAYLQTKLGEFHEVELNTWINLANYYDSDKINLIILLYPKGDGDSTITKNPIINATISNDKSFYTVVINYRGHLTKYWWTNKDSTKRNYTGQPFNIFENCTIYVQGITGIIESEIVSKVLDEIDETFTIPVISINPSVGPTESIVITIGNWGVTDAQEYDIEYL
jgi:hypothetical protein